MALAFHVGSIPVTGTLVEAAAVRLGDGGVGPCRLFVENAATADGGNNLSAAKVQIGPDLDDVADFDTTTFASLAQGAEAQLLIPAPVSAVRLLATCAAGTILEVWLDSAQGG